PARLARCRRERPRTTDPLPRVAHSVDHERRPPEVRSNPQLRISCRESRLAGGPPPDDAKRRHVALVDLIEWRVFRAAGVAVIAAPLTVLRAVLRAEGGGSCPDRDGDQSD